jgi:hypothetical protein
MQPYRESVSSGDDWLAITRVVAPGPANTPAETCALTFTLQRAPTRLLRIGFEKNRRLLQQEAIQNPMTVQLLLDPSGFEFPLWQLTQGTRDSRHLTTRLYFNEEDWWYFHPNLPRDMIIMRVEQIGKRNIALALRWIQQKLSNDLRLDFEERWRAFLSSQQPLARNADALAAVKSAYKRTFYHGSSEEKHADVDVRRRLQARWGAFLQTPLGKKMAEHTDTLAQVKKQLKRAMHQPPPPAENVWYEDHSREDDDAWRD